MVKETNTHEANKSVVLLHLAGCSTRDGLNEQQQTQLEHLRLDVMLAIEANHEVDLRRAKTALLGFYEALDVIRNGDNVMTAMRAMASDVERLHAAVQQYDPHHQNPRYGRG